MCESMSNVPCHMWVTVYWKTSICVCNNVTERQEVSYWMIGNRSGKWWKIWTCPLCLLFWSCISLTSFCIIEHVLLHHCTMPSFSQIFMIHNPCKYWGYFACDIYSFPDSVSKLLLALLIKQTWNSGMCLRFRLSDMSSYTELPAC